MPQKAKPTNTSPALSLVKQKISLVCCATKGNKDEKIANALAGQKIIATPSDTVPALAEQGKKDSEMLVQNEI